MKGFASFSKAACSLRCVRSCDAISQVRIGFCELVYRMISSTIPDGAAINLTRTEASVTLVFGPWARDTVVWQPLTVLKLVSLTFNPSGVKSSQIIVMPLLYAQNLAHSSLLLKVSAIPALTDPFLAPRNNLTFLSKRRSSY